MPRSLSTHTRSLARAVATAMTAIATLALIAPTSHANDGVFGGEGAHPMPMETSAVRMADEIVTLTLDPKARAWKVHTSFIFENTTDEAVTLTVGFPFQATEGMADDEDGPGEPIVWDFETRVRDEVVEARRGETSVNPGHPDLVYAYAYLSEVTFAPGERVHIENTYQHGVAVNREGVAFASYVLQTGATWKGGRIGHARLSVEVPSWRWALCPPDHADVGPPARPAGFATSPRHGAPGFEVHWSLADHAPREDLFVCLVDLDAYASMRFATGLSDTPLDGLDADSRERLRDTVYALRGRPFADADQRAHFEGKWWYRPDPTFTEARLSDEERAFVAKVSAGGDR